MTRPQIPTHWHPDTYAVDEINKVIWKQGSHALALNIKHNGQPVPGYTTSLCTAEELVGVRHRINLEKAKRVRSEGVLASRIRKPIEDKDKLLLEYRSLCSNHFSGGEFKKPWLTTALVGALTFGGLWELALILAVIRLWLEHYQGREWARLGIITSLLERCEMTNEDLALSEKPLTSAEKRELDALKKLWQD